ncbi:MAG: hypothetical protein R2748_12305 [Bryobacterales bacterium]
MTRFAVPLLLTAAAAAFAQDLARKAPPEIDDALKTRVSQFYQHFQRGEFRQAEGFLDEESKDLFYNSKKNRILDFNIQNVDYGGDFRSANVLVVCKTIIAMLGSEPVNMPLNSDWRYNEGEWRMHLTEHKRPEGADASSPFGPMSFSQDVAAPGSAFQGQQGPAMARPTVESLASMYRISTDTLTFPKASQDPVSRSMTVKSASVGRLTVEKKTGPIAGIEVEIEGADIEPGGEATIKFTYDPAKAEHVSGRVRVDFMVMPISQSFQVFLDF